MIDTKELRRMVNAVQFESFANSVINSLLDRLEAAEQDATQQRILAKEALRAAERREKKCDELRINLDDHRALVFDLRKEVEKLRAKVAEMEKQEPFDADHPEFRRAFDAALKTGNWPTERKNFGYRSPMSQMAWQVAFCTVNNLKLYAIPGAQNVPKEAIAKILTEVMDIAVSNGADSRSMPDEYVEVASWLCGAHGAKGENK